VCGFPCSVWIDLFLHSHNRTSQGALFVAWPDGESLLEQETALLLCFGTIREFIK